MNQAERSWDGMFTAGPFQRHPGSSRLEQGDGHHHVLYLDSLKYAWDGSQGEVLSCQWCTAVEDLTDSRLELERDQPPCIGCPGNSDK